MATSVRVDHFRGFDALEISDIRPVNLVAGRNSTGKTGLLEALFLLAGKASPELAVRVNAWRALPIAVDDVAGTFASIFLNFDTQVPANVALSEGEEETERLSISISGTDSDIVPIDSPSVAGRSEGAGAAPAIVSQDALEFRWTAAGQPALIRRGRFIREERGGTTTVSLRVEPRSGQRTGPQTIFIHSMSHVSPEEDRTRFTDLVQNGGKASLIACLRGINQQVADVELLSVGAETLIHADVGVGRKVPLGLLGDGLVRATSIFLAAAAARGGTLLVDEIDTGLHHSTLADFWRAIGRSITETSARLFATTHSFECMSAAHDAFSDSAQDFAMHRLERINGNTVCRSFDHRMLGVALEKGFEVR